MSVVVRAYVLLVVSRGVITLLPLRTIAGHLGDEVGESDPVGDLTPAQASYARRVGWSIRKVAPHTPTNSNCYPQALTARTLLHRKGIPSTVYYGAAFNPDGSGLETHVWVRCGSIVVTGAPAHHGFAVVSTYSDARSLESAPL